MVYRIQPKPHSRVKHFMRIWWVYFLLSFLFSIGLESLLDAPRRDSYGELAVVMGLITAACAWLNVRAWARLGWFSGEPCECFLTMVEEGLILEEPAKGLSFYLPWKGMSYRCRGGVLMLFTDGAMRFLVSVNGLPRGKRSAILSGLREHAGPSQARHELLAQQNEAEPFASASARGELPPLPSDCAPIPPPSPIMAGSSASFANMPRQWNEGIRLLLRPDWCVCLLIWLAIAGFSLLAGMLAWEGEYLSGGGVLFVAAFLISRLGRPGTKRHRSVPGSICMEVTATELIERWKDGSWARFRLPAPEKARLVRLSESWCLLRDHELGAFLFDAKPPLPPQLAAYRRENAPNNGLRVAFSVAVSFFCAALGYFLVGFPQEPTEAERAFQALLPQPDGAALSAYVEEYVASGPLYGTPQLEPDFRQDGQELAGYVLTFTEGESAPEAAESAHFVWETCVRFYPDGRVHDHECWPAGWCPCEECTFYRLAP